jgi:hypothetical protein
MTCYKQLITRFLERILLNSLFLLIGADFIAGLLKVASEGGVDATDSIRFLRDLGCVCAAFKTIFDSRSVIVGDRWRHLIGL